MASQSLSEVFSDDSFQLCEGERVNSSRDELTSSEKTGLS